MLRFAMPPGTDFTWDWIVRSCQKMIEQLSQSIAQDPSRVQEGQESIRRSFEALILAVEQLREHPALASNIPMKSLATLRWFPQDGYEVNVYYDPPKFRYQVTIYKRSPTTQSGSDSLAVEQTYVYLSKLPDTVARFIDKTE